MIKFEVPHKSFRSTSFILDAALVFVHDCIGDTRRYVNPYK
jgi:hypothetical protein